ncbi:dihydroxy-acid dehydratase, partial [Stenotrophomonas maltophilia]|uniref:dihydroxy-acid dehydratase domain-containing protein n=1 Tax=Stenotrophomonas maltophilia TaxID=40324 RepID=UPI001EF94FD5
MLAGGMPMVFPTISIAESFAHPTSMFLRNLMAMDTEEMVRAQPMDAVVVIGGCDKTLPAQIMAAASVDLPTIVVPVGPMVVGHH